VKKPRRGEQPNLEELYEGERLFHTCAELLDKHLKGQNFIACGRLTVADFSVGPGSSRRTRQVSVGTISRNQALASIAGDASLLAVCACAIRNILASHGARRGQ